MALLGSGVIVVLATYLSFTNNPAIGASLLVFLPFLLCPIVCGAIGGAMWFSRSKIKQRDSMGTDKKIREMLLDGKDH